MPGERKRDIPTVTALLALSALIQLDAAVPVAGMDFEALLPVTAEALMPLETQQGVYLVTEGSEKGKKVPFTFEQHGEQWILTKHEMARHELRRDKKGNIVIDRETNFRDDLEIDYASPVMLLPAMVDRNTSLTGKTRVIVRNARTKSVKYRGICNWRLNFIGVAPVETRIGTFPVYRFRASREIRLSLAKVSMTVDFEYARGKGMIATGVDQVIRSLGLFTDRDIWRLEQLPDTP